MNIASQFIRILWKNLQFLLYPRTCILCQKELDDDEGEICPSCLLNLAYTHYEMALGETELEKLFWGRFQFEFCYSVLFFEKRSSTQKILHAIKYKNNAPLAYEMGCLIGVRMRYLEQHTSIDLLIPVPLHPDKMFQRGYNQAEKISQGISDVLGIPTNEHYLKRGINSESQTKKSIFARWENVESVFFVDFYEHRDQYQHIALVDDVITTGSTIEACARLIQKDFPQLKISIISLAVAKQP